MRLLAFFAVAPLMAANYTAQRVTVDGVEVIRLTDSFHKIEVSIDPAYGNNSYEMKVNGKNVFWTPFAGPAEHRNNRRHLGNPFLAPWANRLDRDGFFANGREYRLNPGLKNFGRDGHQQPIHGLLVYAPWEVVEAKADDKGAWVTSRLEFWKQPDLMAQFPFAHSYEMTYRLQDGALEVDTRIRNLSTETMPVSVAFHPYFRLYDAPRDKWKVFVPAREHVVLSEKLTPTGEKKPVEPVSGVTLESRTFDDVFAGLVRGESGRAEFAVEGDKQRVAVLFGPKYTVAVVYAPKGRGEFICFEPMSGPTNAFNLAHTGLYKELQTIPPGGEWRESFWVKATGF